ncbi:hypothetical protein [Actinomyces viscosus]|uniref:hypothetical protein n=1 Tax=Actinomyces viscosus TaxID=1656 RepID=UPI0022B2A5D0|nr:hypothetical protein [Actinomyces viscosus]
MSDPLHPRHRVHLRRDRRGPRARGASSSPTSPPPPWTSTARFGGIIPEIASRAHLESFLPTLDAALEKADVRSGRGRRRRGCAPAPGSSVP